ncbi:MAG: 30S ribosomal protein S20 [Candidatus Omnitrophota bacterium]|nr:30S ribosomal protein S20 [Candidatus Omnitrophota bacterium]
MPQRRAAKKALRQSLKRHKKNLTLQKQIKTAIKKFKKTLESKDSNASNEALKTLYRILDKTAAKRIIHPNKAARKKSDFAKLLNKTGSQ